MGRRRRPRLPQDPVEVAVESLNHDGKGVSRVDDKVVFIHGALPGERVKFRYTGRYRRHDEGIAVEILESAPQRVEPACPHYGVCGGCALQHMDAAAQIEAKQAILLENLEHIGGVAPGEVLPPLRNSSPWGYRRKARLGVKDVPRKGRVLVGFRERGSAFIADLRECLVLHPKVGRLLEPLSDMIGRLSIRARLPQIEVAMDDKRCILIFRILDPLAGDDRDILLSFGRDHDLSVYVQPGGPDTVAPLEAGIDLHYALPAHELELGFLPGDFTQVNTEINRAMVDRAIDMLAPGSDERVIDLFCGMGNFTLPLARRAGHVTGIEGDAGLVERARANASRNGLANTTFHVANLYEDIAGAPWLKQGYDKALIDPPRSGAQEIMPLVSRLGIRRLVYVSCYPGTLARDAGMLVREHGYDLVAAGVMDMFPHTSHVESIALFERR